jgi:hypothetical protein
MNVNRVEIQRLGERSLSVGIACNRNPNIGDASLTLEYLDGSTQLLVFLDSGQATWLFLTNGSGEIDGLSTWTQTTSLPEGSVFRIVSSAPSEQYDLTMPFQGGQLGAYLQAIVFKYSTSAPPITPPFSQSGHTIAPPSPPVRTPSNIHAVIVSGLSDPAKVVASPDVTLTGGIIALGREGSASQTPSSWSPGFKIIPDYALLTGEKIPPVTPNIIDVRIVRQDVIANFPSAASLPEN